MTNKTYDLVIWYYPINPSQEASNEWKTADSLDEAVTSAIDILLIDYSTTNIVIFNQGEFIVNILFVRDENGVGRLEARNEQELLIGENVREIKNHFGLPL